MRKTSVNVWVSLVTLFPGVNFNVQAQTWSFTGNMKYYHASHTATLLNNGEVLIAGGLELGAEAINAELYNPSSGSFTVTGNLNTGAVRPWSVAAEWGSSDCWRSGDELRFGWSFECGAVQPHHRNV